jgi:hypothetical protein
LRLIHIEGNALPFLEHVILFNEFLNSGDIHDSSHFPFIHWEPETREVKGLATGHTACQDHSQGMEIKSRAQASSSGAHPWLSHGSKGKNQTRKPDLQVQSGREQGAKD